MIYTKKGDGGTTSLLGGKKRISKSSQVIRAIGSVDEVNSYLGVCLSNLNLQSKSKKELINKLLDIQRDLFTMGAILAGAKIKLPSYRVIELEKEIDFLEEKLPVQKNFILPGGTAIAAHFIYTRALVRRAERELVKLSLQSKFGKYKQQIIYLNRLSDYLFILARKLNSDNKILGKVWKAQ